MMAMSGSCFPRGLVVCPISTGRLELRRFVSAHFAVLSKASGLRVLYQGVGNPRQTDGLYRGQRTPEKRRQDEDAALRYRQAVEDAGGEDHYLREQDEAAIERFGLKKYARPLIAFVTGPVSGNQAVLPIDARIFDFPEGERALLDLLRTELTARKIEKLAEHGIFTAKSMRELQHHLHRVRRRAVKIVEDRLAASPGQKRQRDARSAARGRPDPSTDTELSFWMLKSGGIGVAVIRSGQLQGKANFCKRKGRPTLGGQLILLLSQSPGYRVRMIDIARNIYADQWRRASGVADDQERILGCVRTLVANTRDKLGRNGIDKRIITSLSPEAQHSALVELRVQKLKLLGDAEQADPSSIPNVPLGLDDPRVPTVDPEDSI